MMKDLFNTQGLSAGFNLVSRLEKSKNLSEFRVSPRNDIHRNMYKF